MLDKLSQKPILTIIFVVGLMLLINIDVLQVSIMEARNFITAREMVIDGNWIMTTMNGEPRYQKPPLPTWLTAISSMIFGLKSLFGLRLPAVIMIMVVGIYGYLFSRKLLKNHKHAFVNALIMITSFYVIAIIVEAPWDIFAHGFTLIACYYLLLLFGNESKYWKNAILAGIFIGCSILSKAPVSVYALLLPFLISYGITYKYKGFKRKALAVVSLIIVALLFGGWWFLYVRSNDPETFMAMANKETGNWSSYNVRPFYYYWSFFTQSGLWTIPAFISLLYPYLKSRVKNAKAYQLTLFWTIISLILLSIIPEKKSRYLMPLLIPLALNTGFYINYLIDQFKDLKSKVETFPVYFNFGLIGLIAFLFPLTLIYMNEFLQDQYLIWFFVASVVICIIGIALLFQLRRKRLDNVFLLTVGFMVSAFIFILPLTKSLYSTNYNPILNLKNLTEKNDIKVYSLGGVSPETIWQFGDKIQPLTINNLLKGQIEGSQFGILTDSINSEKLKALEKSYTIVKEAEYDLNIVNKDSRQYRDRLVSHYFELTKK
ncbi:MAG: phospholipid carrier-dependent glycosyltransferase [Flavobacteriaceae bacterium]|nr:glycosyltransferase family 39 protein [Bacteroidia bacterium]NNL62057.1 phospholipid carrier-dependent glycosyltransferase [Flavobacteriaceae bacterium]